MSEIQISNNLKNNTTASSILIVDDKPEDLCLLSGLLIKEGYDVHTLDTGNTVLSFVLQSPPDLIFLDTTMPDINCYDVCRQIKSSKSIQDIPVIFISELSETINKTEVFATGGADYIIKPLHKQELFARISMHLSMRKATKNLEQTHRLPQNKNETSCFLTLMHALAEKNGVDESVNLTKSTFWATISEKIQTPINDIIEFSTLALKTDLTCQQRDYINKVSMSAQNLLGIISHILDFFRIDGGNFPELLSHLAGINTQTGLSRVNGDMALYQNLLVKFYNGYQNITSQIQEAIAKQEQTLAVRLVHTVKGLSGTIGAHVLQKIAEELEAALKSDIHKDHADLIAQFDTAMHMILKTLSPVVSVKTNKTTSVNQESIKQGNIDQLIELLKRLQPFLQKKKPKPCKDIMAEIQQFVWEPDISKQLQEIERLVGKYRFKEAQEIAVKLII